MQNPKEVAATFVQEKTNPRISVKIGDRGAAMNLVVLYRDTFNELLPKFSAALNKEGPINKLAAASKGWGNKAYVQANIAESLASGKSTPEFARVLQDFLKEIKNKEQNEYSLENLSNTKYKLFQIKLNSRLNPTTEDAEIVLYDVLDSSLGLIVFEVAEDVTGITKKGVTAFKALKGAEEAQRAASPPKLSTFQGKKGYWVTTGGGRRIFIEESKFKGFRNWTTASNLSKKLAAAGVAGVGLGAVGVIGLQKLGTQVSPREAANLAKKAASYSVAKAKVGAEQVKKTVSAAAKKAKAAAESAATRAEEFAKKAAERARKAAERAAELRAKGSKAAAEKAEAAATRARTLAEKASAAAQQARESATALAKAAKDGSLNALDKAAELSSKVRASMTQLTEAAGGKVKFAAGRAKGASVLALNKIKEAASAARTSASNVKGLFESRIKSLSKRNARVTMNKITASISKSLSKRGTLFAASGAGIFAAGAALYALTRKKKK